MERHAERDRESKVQYRMIHEVEQELEGLVAGRRKSDYSSTFKMKLDGYYLHALLIPYYTHLMYEKPHVRSTDT